MMDAEKEQAQSTHQCHSGGVVHSLPSAPDFFFRQIVDRDQGTVNAADRRKFWSIRFANYASIRAVSPAARLLPRRAIADCGRRALPAPARWATGIRDRRALKMAAGGRQYVVRQFTVKIRLSQSWWPPLAIASACPTAASCGANRRVR